MDALLIALGLAGLLVGATGTWSPCGLSMIETIGPTGHTGGLPTTLAASATFAPFAVAGAVITFGSLAVAGDAVHGAGGAIAYGIAAAVALAAAFAEARGLPIVPQVRRQLPIGWRQSVPMPLAAAGYGALLGLGFTTFILSYGVWALMGISLALGEPLAGLVIGLGFGIGRALPIVALAPIADHSSGERICEAMTMRRGIYRGARLGDALALAVVAVVLAGSVGAEAARKEVPKASDPAAGGKSVAYELDRGGAELRVPGETRRLPGSDPANGGPWVAVIAAGGISVLDRKTLEEVSSRPAAAVDALAVSKGWLAWRVHRDGRDVISVAPLSDKGGIGTATVAAKVEGPGQLSRPAVDGRSLVYALSKRAKSKLIQRKLLGAGPGGKRTLVSSRTTAVTAPSVSGNSVAYVLTSKKRQSLKLKGPGGGKGRTLMRARPGPPTLWNTAIAGKRVFVTVVKRGGASKLVSVGR